MRIKETNEGGKTDGKSSFSKAAWDYTNLFSKSMKSMIVLTRRGQASAWLAGTTPMY